MKIPVRSLVFVTCLLALRQSPAAQAAATRPDDVSELLAAIVKDTGVPGLAAVAVHHQKIVAQGAAGVRARGADAKVTINDRFHLGSCTKSMTATLVAMLVEQGKLKWNSTCGEVFESNIKEIHDGWKNVTLEQLVTNRSGAPGGLDFEGLWGKLW